jgi:alpha-glucosidase
MSREKYDCAGDRHVEDVRRMPFSKVCSSFATKIAVALILILQFATLSTSAQERWDPVADAKAIVMEGNARFTLLTPQMIRMEWTADGKFEDYASLVFVNRRLPVPEFGRSVEKGWLVLRTEKVTLRYRRKSGEFTKENLRVEFDVAGSRVTWTPGMEDKGNLGGTIRTLDGVRGKTDLPPGLLSRDGWVVVDDSGRPLLDNSDWPWVIPRPADRRQDWYFFAYGRDYKRALMDFTRVAGRIPLPPRFVFGAWWSRYWSYTDKEFMDLVRGFEQHDIPLDVLVVDMDWHLTFGVKWWENKKDQSGHTLGWTGYTWNKTLFPDPSEFLRWVHARGLKTTLNMHPASGVQPHEEQYPEFARAMGIDPATQKYVPFEIEKKKFAENYFKILHHPFEQQGVDFFWLDWQQQHITRIPSLNPTWWLNYTHFTDMERRNKRGLLYHRWGGLGNHRYQIGFSGDTIAVWESLAFQPYFTATAANVLYGYWSHDIGGHMRAKLGAKPEVGRTMDPDYPELYTRWIQYGVFSPILRTHTTKDPESERRIWAYPAEYAAVMRDAFLLRYALIPYIYTAARKSYDTGISPCRPMYYDYPQAPEGYEYRDQYMFGDDLLVAPIAEPLDSKDLLAMKKIWLPPGDWIEWHTGSLLKGPAKVERSFALDEIPVYVIAGAILPMQPKMRNTGEKPVDPLILTIFPGEAGETRIYEDAGNDLGYQRGEFAWTTVRHSRASDGTTRIEILPADGSYPGMLEQRGVEIRLEVSAPPESVSAGNSLVPFSRDGAAPSWKYDGDTLTTVISLPPINVRQKLDVRVKPLNAMRGETDLLNGTRGRLARMKRAMTMLNNSWPQGWSPDSLLEAVQTGRRITLQPARATEELRQFRNGFAAVTEDIRTMQADCESRIRALAHLGVNMACEPQPKASPR